MKEISNVILFSFAKICLWHVILESNWPCNYRSINWFKKSLFFSPQKPFLLKSKRFYKYWQSLPVTNVSNRLFKFNTLSLQLALLYLNILKLLVNGFTMKLAHCSSWWYWSGWCWTFLFPPLSLLGFVLRWMVDNGRWWRPYIRGVSGDDAHIIWSHVICWFWLR